MGNSWYHHPEISAGARNLQLLEVVTAGKKEWGTPFNGSISASLMDGKVVVPPLFCHAAVCIQGTCYSIQTYTDANGVKRIQVSENNEQNIFTQDDAVYKTYFWGALQCDCEGWPVKRSKAELTARAKSWDGRAYTMHAFGQSLFGTKTCNCQDFVSDMIAYAVGAKPHPKLH